MGNNYYLCVNGKSYHLGKSSGGWKFCLNIIRILKAIIDNLGLEEMKVIKEVYELVSNSTNLKYKNNELEIENFYEDMPDIINYHKWLLNYTDIFIGHNDSYNGLNKESVYVQINISVITKKQLKSWLRKLFEIEDSHISDEEGDKWDIDEFINMIDYKTGIDLISHACKKEPTSHWMSLSVEYKIGNLRCSSHEDFD